MLRDFGHAIRRLGHTKGWTAVVLVSLALGIGANTALFTAVNGVLLQSVALPDPDALVRLKWSGKNDMMRSSSDYGSSQTYQGQNVRSTVSYRGLSRDAGSQPDAHRPGGRGAVRRLQRRDRRGRRPGQRLSGERQLLQRAARAAPARARPGRGRRSAGSVTRGGDQPRVLAEALRRRSRRRGPHRHDERPAGDDRRRDPPGIHRGSAARGNGPRRDGAHCARDAPVPDLEAGAGAHDLVPADDGEAEAGHHARAGAGQSRRRVPADGARGTRRLHGGSQRRGAGSFPQSGARIGAAAPARDDGASRRLRPGYELDEIRAHPRRGRGARAADCLRQRREPAARARGLAPQGDRDPPGDGRDARAARASVAHRERRALGPGRPARFRRRLLEPAVAAVRRDGAARLARVCLRRRAQRPDRPACSASCPRCGRRRWICPAR